MTLWYDTLSYGGATNDESINQTGGASKRGEAPVTGSSAMIGEEVKQVVIPIKHAGTALTGTITLNMRLLADDSLLQQIGTLDASSVTSSYVDYTFTAVTPYTMIEDSTLSVECSWSASSTQYIFIKTNGDIYDSTNSGKTYYFSTSSPPWSSGNANDMIMSINDEGGTPPSAAGTRLPPPPLIARF